MHIPMLQAYLRRPRMGAWSAWCSSSWCGLPAGAPPLSHSLLSSHIGPLIALQHFSCLPFRTRALASLECHSTAQPKLKREAGRWMQGLGGLGPECFNGTPLLAAARAAAGDRGQPARADGLPCVVPRAGRGIPGVAQSTAWAGTLLARACMHCRCRYRGSWQTGG